MIRVRFAPTATGNLYVSGARVALANYLFARSAGGRMVLRIDDLDNGHAAPRASPRIMADQIMQDLAWVGIDWDTSFRQSERQELYQDTIERLRRDKLIYPCFETEAELKAKQEFRRKRNQSVVYDRAMLSLTEKQRHDAEAGGKRPHWRFKLSGRTVEWTDLILGPRRASLSAVSDPILVRADGSPTPILASVIDDIDQHTTHIIRGEDNAGNTATQIELFEVLRRTRTPVRFGHLPALRDSGKPDPGERRNENLTVRGPRNENLTVRGPRNENLTVRGLRNDGVEPAAIIACLSGADPRNGQPVPLSELAKGFQLAEFAAARFDIARMLALNRIVLRNLDFAAVADRLPVGATPAFWLAVRGNLDLLKEARGWWDVVAGTIVPPVVEGSRDVLLTAGSLLPAEPWDNAVWSDWISALECATGQPAAALLIPLRLALTGEDSGPDLANLLPLIGRPRAATRLAMTAA